MTAQVTRLTISLPQELALLADEMARDRGISRSRLVSLCLQELAEKRFRAEMEEGYKAMAKENLKVAGMAMDSAREVLPRWE